MLPVYFLITFNGKELRGLVYNTQKKLGYLLDYFIGLTASNVFLVWEQTTLLEESFSIGKLFDFETADLFCLNQDKDIKV